MPATTPAQRGLRRGYRFALIGLLVGFIGLGVAAYRMSIEAEKPPPPKTREISDVLSDTVKKTADKLRGRETPGPEAEPAWRMSKKLGVVASVCGFVAAGMGCVSWLVREHRRWTWAALAVGIAALAWQHVVVAVAIGVGAAVFLFVMRHVDVG